MNKDYKTMTNKYWKYVKKKKM